MDRVVGICVDWLLGEWIDRRPSPRTQNAYHTPQGMPQEVLNACASICRPCHSAVHRSHDNDTLGQSFHSVALLLADEKASRD